MRVWRSSLAPAANFCAECVGAYLKEIEVLVAMGTRGLLALDRARAEADEHLFCASVGS